MFKPVLIFGLWILGMAFAVANGFVGNLLIMPTAGEYAGHAYKSVLAVAFIFFIGWLHAGSTRGAAAMRSAWIAGGTWLALTMTFEFLAGHYIFGNSWEKLFADYQIWRGRLWLLVLAALFFGPVIMAAILRGRGPENEPA